MDYDILNKIANAATKAVVSQDTTELLAVCQPNVVLLLGNFKIILDKEQGIPHAESSAGSTTPRSGRNTTVVRPAPLPASVIKSSPRASPRKASPPRSVAGSLAGSATIAAPVEEAAGTLRSSFRGIRDVGLATLQVYRWLQSGKLIAEPHFTCEVRRQRRVDADGNGQTTGRGGRSGGASLAASTTQQQQPTSAPQQQDLSTMSRVELNYGRPNMKLQDILFVTDDGLIACIQRSTVTPTDPTAPAYTADLAAFRASTGEERKPATAGIPPAVLDFSFRDLSNPMDLLQTDPVSGKEHKVAGIKQKDTAASDGVLYHLSQVQKTDKVMVKARNRDGEEEAYEFAKETRTILSDAKEREEQEERDLLKRLVSGIRKKYQCNSLRLCSNNFSDLSKLMGLLPNVIVNTRLTVTWLDLSCNQISAVPPGLSTLPLSTLYLHANAITDWQAIKSEVCALPELTVVTLYGNPLATKTPNYRQFALGVLLDAENGGANALPLKSLDFVALTPVDRRVCGMLQQFTGGVERHLKRLASPPKRRGASPPNRR